MTKVFSEKMRWISYICSIFIVFTHATAKMPELYDNKAGLAYHFTHYAGFLVVPAMGWFFFTSAYLFFNKYENTSSVYFDKIKKRLKTLLVPYLIWNIIAYLASVFLYNSTNELNLASLVNSVVFYYLPNNFHPCFDGPMWYVFRLLTYMLVAPLFYFLCKKNSYFIVTMITTISLCFYFNVNYYSFFYWIPVFMIGCYLAINKNIQTNFLNIVSGVYFKDKNISNVFGLIIFLVFFATVYVTGNYFDYSERFYYIIRMSFSVITFFFCIMFTDKIKKAPSFIVAAPFFTYCIHIIVMRCLIPFFRHNIVPYVPNMAIGYIIFTLATLIVIYIVLLILKKYFPKVLSFLNGSR